MTELFAVNTAHAAPVPTTTLPAEGLEERAHLQEWVLAHPGVLGEDVMVITSE
jgi:hypothetical protein